MVTDVLVKDCTALDCSIDGLIDIMQKKRKRKVNSYSMQINRLKCCTFFTRELLIILRYENQRGDAWLIGLIKKE